VNPRALLLDGGRRARSLQLLVALIALCALIISWPTPGQSAGGIGGVNIDHGPQAVGPVTVVGVTSGLVWADNASTATSITVQNTSAAPVRAMVWWILGRLGDAEPWNDPAMESAHLQVTLAAHATKTVLLPSSTVAAVRPGIYRLSLWAHNLDVATGQWIHSDGREMIGNVQVVHAPTNIAHLKPASTNLWLDGADPLGSWVSGGPAHLRVQIVNASAVVKTVQVRWSLAGGRGSSTRSMTAASTVNPGTVTTLNVPMTQLPHAGSKTLSVTLYESGPAGSIQQDEIQLPAPITVASK
jgi:hypothetical protein